MDVTPSDEAAPRSDAASRDLPVDPDVVRAERVSVPARMRPAPGPGNRRRAKPRVSWSRLVRALVRRRDVLAVIALGGSLGSLGRWGLAEVIPRGPGEFPWATFIANVSGCFLIGLLMVFVIEVWPPSRYLRPFLGVGILGGYTTFSTYMLDTRSLLVNGTPQLAGVYLFGSMAAGFAAVWLAVFSARAFVRLSRRRRHRRRDREVGDGASAHSGPLAGAREGDAGGLGANGWRPDGPHAVHDSDQASRRTR